MRIELTMLGASLLLAFVQIMLTAHFRTRQHGIRWNAGARDEALPPPTVLVGRLQRAQANLFETLPLFIGAVLGCAAAGHFGGRSAIGAQLYFWARLVYVPLYALGIPMVRSLVWVVSIVGLLLVIASLLLG